MAGQRFASGDLESFQKIFPRFFLQEDRDFAEKKTPLQGLVA
jgi:hypothetical protein